MIGDRKCDPECNVEACEFDFPDCDEKSGVEYSKIYVRSSIQEITGSGTKEDPYTSLYLALMMVSSPYTTIYLLKGDHYLYPDVSDPCINDTECKPLERDDGTTFQRINILTLLCKDDDSIEDCAEEGATVYFKEKINISVSSCIFTIANINLSGYYAVCSEDFCQDCSNKYCRYCPYVYMTEEGINISDTQETISDEDLEGYGRNCDAFFGSLNYFQATEDSSLIFIDVNFYDFTEQANALIYIHNSNLTLISVNFERIHTGMDVRKSVIQIETDQGVEVSFKYLGGSIKYLNDGFEINSALTQGGFIYIDAYAMNMHLYNLEFSFNIVQSVPQAGQPISFIYIRALEFDILMKHLNFTNNYVSLGLINIRGDLNTQDKLFKLKMVNLSLEKNSVKKGLINLSAMSYNIKAEIENLSVDRCISTETQMIYLTSQGNYATTMSKSEFYNLNKDSILFSINNITISRSFSNINLLEISNILNVHVTKLTIESSGDQDYSTADIINEYTLNDFLSSEEVSLKKGNPYSYNIECDLLIIMKDIYYIYLIDTTYRSNKCKIDSAIILAYSYPVYIQGLLFEDTEFNNEKGGGVLRISDARNDEIIIKDGIFRNITSLTGYFTVGVYNADRALISNLKFSNITSEGLGTLVAYQLKRLRISSCDFEDIRFVDGRVSSQGLKSGGALSISLADQVTIDNCNFINVAAKNRPSAILVDVSKQLIISNSNFTRIESEFNGAVMATSAVDMSITGSIFNSVVSYEGRGAGIFAEMVGHNTIEKSINLDSLLFDECITYRGQGCIYITSSDIVELNMVIRSIQINKGQAVSGSAIYLHNTLYLGVAVIKDIQVSDNQNKNDSPIYTAHLSGVLVLKDSTFTSNKGPIASISTLLSNSGKLLVLENLSIYNNECTQASTDLFGLTNLSEIESTKLYLYNNTCTGLRASKVTITDSNSIYDTNFSGVRIEGNAQVTMHHARIMNNINAYKAGGIHLLYDSKFSCIDCKIIKNTSVLGGAIVVEQDGNLELIGCDILENYAENAGSAIYMIASTKYISKLDSCVISDNISAIESSIQCMISNIEIRNSRIENNISYSSTPGIVLNYSTLKLYNTTTQYHNATIGAFILSQTGSIVDIEDSIFQHGTASQFGGAIAAIGSWLKFVGSEFYNLYSGEASAAFIVVGGSQLSLDRCKFMNLTSMLPGSVLYSSDSSVLITESNFSIFGKVGIFGKNLKSMHIYNSKFYEGYGDYGSVLSCSDCQEVKVEGSEFNDNQATYTGGALYIVSNKDSVEENTIDSCYFNNNSAEQGGAVYVDGVSLNITNSTFIANRAKNKGGASYLICTQHGDCKFNINESTFTRNSAVIAGGGIYWDDSQPIIDQNTFTANLAKYGGWIASYPVKLEILKDGEPMSRSSDNESIAYVLNEIAPGQTIKEVIQIALVDHYGQIVSSDSSSSAQTLSVDSEDSSVLGTTKVVAFEGVFRFDDIYILSQPGSTVYIEIETSELETGSETSYPSIKLQINLRECVIGESDLGLECKVCSKGTYSLDPGEECKECPEEAYCLGNYTMYPKKNYWRTDVYSDVFYECPNTRSCLGSSDYESYTGECEEGYRGNLCQPCDNGYYLGNEEQCMKCPDEASNKIIVVFVSLGIFLYCIIMVKSTFRAVFRSNSLHSIYIKIFTNYLQLVGITLGLRLPWPKTLLEFFNLHENAGKASEQAFSFDCFIQSSDEESYIDTYYNKMIIIEFIPFAGAIICALIWGSFAIHYRSLRYLKIELCATAVILFFYIHPALTSTFLSIFSCRDIEGEFYLNVNLDIECWKGDHLKYALSVALPGVIVWVIGVPLGIMMYLAKRIRQLKTLEMKQKFGFLYIGYRYSTSYWEIVLIMRNVIVIMIMVFLSNYTVDVKALACLLVLLVSYYYQASVKPYKHVNLNEVEKKGIMSATITIYFGLYFLEEGVDEGAKIGLFMVILLANIYFIVVWISNLAAVLIEQLKNSVGIMRRLFDRQDGFESHILCESPAVAQVYNKDEENIVTLINSQQILSYIPSSLPTNMIGLYSRYMKSVNLVEEDEHLDNGLYFKNVWQNSSMSYYSNDTDSIYVLDETS